MPSTIVKTIQLDSMLITRSSDDIVHVTYLQGKVIDVEEKKQELQANLEITGGEKLPFMLSVESYVTITKEAKEYSIEMELQQPFLVTATIVDNLAYQLMADFYFKFYKPQVPYKVFKSKERAREWLIEYRNKHNASLLNHIRTHKVI